MQGSDSMANEEKGFQKNSINCLIPIYLTPPRKPYK